jgi:hypothetical protein
MRVTAERRGSTPTRNAPQRSRHCVRPAAGFGDHDLVFTTIASLLSTSSAGCVRRRLSHVGAPPVDGNDQAALAKQRRGPPYGVVGHAAVTG